jgi:hypothetical protein
MAQSFSWRGRSPARDVEAVLQPVVIPGVIVVLRISWHRHMSVARHHVTDVKQDENVAG